MDGQKNSLYISSSYIVKISQLKTYNLILVRCITIQLSPSPSLFTHYISRDEMIKNTFELGLN